jgi:hypothetical protein
MTFMMENWYIIIGLVAVAVVIGITIGKFLNLPTGEQIDKCREWLLYAVIQAEQAMGSGTGQLKLRAVYDLFIQRFPVVAKAISFDTFMQWVDDALVEMREMLKNNKKLKQMVEGWEVEQDG